MNDRAKIVLWLGITMIVIQVIKEWPLIRSAIFTSPSGVPSGYNPPKDAGGFGASQGMAHSEAECPQAIIKAGYQCAGM